MIDEIGENEKMNAEHFGAKEAQEKTKEKRKSR